MRKTLFSYLKNPGKKLINKINAQESCKTNCLKTEQKRNKLQKVDKSVY